MAAYLTALAAPAAWVQPALDAPGYFAHLTSPDLPTLRLFDVLLGGVSAHHAAHGVELPQNTDIAVSLNLALINAPAHRAGVRIRLEGESGVAEETHWIPTNEWSVGGVNTWSTAFRVPGFTLSGRGTISIVQLLPRAPGPIPLGDEVNIPVDAALLFRGPVLVTPTIARSYIDAAMLAEAFGRSFARLNAAVRLAPETTVRVDVPQAVGNACTGLGMLLALGGDFDRDHGEPIAVLRCEPSGTIVEVRAGEDGSFLDATTRPPGVVRLAPNADPITVAAPFADWHDASADATIYKSVHRFEKPEDVRGVTIEYTNATGFVDVFEMVSFTGGTQ